jgi:hypothetical protein
VVLSFPVTSLTMAIVASNPHTLVPFVFVKVPAGTVIAFAIGALWLCVCFALFFLVLYLAFQEYSLALQALLTLLAVSFCFIALSHTRAAGVPMKAEMTRDFITGVGSGTIVVGVLSGALGLLWKKKSPIR